MICPNCRNDVSGNPSVCPICGAPLTQYAPPAYAPVDPFASMRNNILIFGILGIAFSEFGILGIIFSAIGLKKVKAFLAAGGNLTGKAKVGRILAKVGLIFGIVCAVCWLIYIIAFFALMSSGISYALDF